MDIEILITALVPGGLLLLVALFYISFPPKNINYLYGYRTRRSIKNTETWDFANKNSAKMLIVIAVLTLFLGGVGYLISPAWALTIATTSLLVGAVIGLWWCENRLKIHFDEDGVPYEK